MMKLLGLKLTRQEEVRDQIFQKSFFFSPQEQQQIHLHFGNNKYIYIRLFFSKMDKVWQLKAYFSF